MSEPTPASGLFRKEALDHLSGARQEGRVLRVDPFWLRWSYRVVVAALVAGIAFMTLARVDEVERGAALVRLGGGGARVVALLPANLRPRLRAGAPLVLTLPEYPDAACALTIARVEPQALGGAALRARLGEGASVLPEAGRPVTLVEARLPRRSFVSRGRALPYLDGMVGTVQVRFGSERLLFALVPGLRALAAGGHGG